MRSLRDFFGSPCPECATDILQPAPQVNRMPRDEASCPTCESTFTLGDLTLAENSRGGFFQRLFGKRKPAA